MGEGEGDVGNVGRGEKIRRAGEEVGRCAGGGWGCGECGEGGKMWGGVGVGRWEHVGGREGEMKCGKCG